MGIRSPIQVNSKPKQMADSKIEEIGMAAVSWKRGRTLGEGGFGFVSLASPAPGSLIAVKTCLLTSSQSLQREAEFLKLFPDAPYIIRFFGVELSHEDGLTLYNLLLEYASGGSLADRLKQEHNFSGMCESEVQRHTKNVLLGLSQVHDLGIIHCDIKPHNILVVQEAGMEIAKIADFGLSMSLEQSKREKHGLRGTKRYLAPESVLGEEYGTGIDIWALGCTVYELITGKPLWEEEESEDPDDILYRIAYDEPNFQDSKMSKEATDFVRVCLVKNPSSRRSARLLLSHPFMNVQPPTKKKVQSGYMSSLRRPHQKTAFKTQPHIRNLIVNH